MPLDDLIYFRLINRIWTSLQLHFEYHKNVIYLTMLHDLQSQSLCWITKYSSTILSFSLSCDNIVSIATSLQARQLRNLGLIPGAHSTSYSMGTRGTSSWGKEGRMWSAHLPPPIAKVKNGWCYISTPPYAFMTCTRPTSPLPCVLIDRF
jgi:hypothetical protein